MPVAVAHTQAVIRVRPTPRLAGYILLLTLLWITSANYNNNLGFILTYLLAAIGLLSPFHTRQQLSNVDVRVDKLRPVFAGETAYVQLRLENFSSLPKYQLRLWIPGSDPVELALQPKQVCQVSVPVETNVRGRWRIQPILMDSVFPLGVFRATAQVAGNIDLWVYPRPVINPPPFPNASSPEPGNELDFEGFRSYQPGDSIRQVHWKGLAKGLELQSKFFRESPLDPDDLILDWDRLPAGNIEQRLEWLCRWLMDAEIKGYCYGLRLPLQIQAPASGHIHLHTCLRHLAEFPRGENS